MSDKEKLDKMRKEQESGSMYFFGKKELNTIDSVKLTLLGLKERKGMVATFVVSVVVIIWAVWSFLTGGNGFSP